MTTIATLSTMVTADTSGFNAALSAAETRAGLFGSRVATAGAQASAGFGAGMTSAIQHVRGLERAIQSGIGIITGPIGWIGALTAAASSIVLLVQRIREATAAKEEMNTAFANTPAMKALQEAEFGQTQARLKAEGLTPERIALHRFETDRTHLLKQIEDMEKRIKDEVFASLIPGYNELMKGMLQQLLDLDNAIERARNLLPVRNPEFQPGQLPGRADFDAEELAGFGGPSAAALAAVTAQVSAANMAIAINEAIRTSRLDANLAAIAGRFEEGSALLSLYHRGIIDQTTLLNSLNGGMLTLKATTDDLAAAQAAAAEAARRFASIGGAISNNVAAAGLPADQANQLLVNSLNAAGLGNAVVNAAGS